MPNNDLHFKIALSLIPLIGGSITRTLIDALGDLSMLSNTNTVKLMSIPGIGEKIATSIVSNLPWALKKSERELLLADRGHIKILSPDHPEYPSRLKWYKDSPYILYKKGDGLLNNNKTIAIVGTRQASQYGIEITKKIVRELCNVPGLSIISGLAIGIDTVAHQASLENKIPTIAIMANGLSKIYPPCNRQLADTIISNHGAWVSENNIEANPDAMRFPARNRIIAGMSDLTLVIEAKSTGGALITAEYANDYSKDVYAVAGRLTDETSMGCIKLIGQHKAHIFTSTEDMLKMMHWDDVRVMKSTQLSLDTLSIDQKRICELLDTGNMCTDEISYRLDIPVNILPKLLISLEIDGYIRSLPGRLYSINKVR